MYSNETTLKISAYSAPFLNRTSCTAGIFFNLFDEHLSLNVTYHTFIQCLQSCKYSIDESTLFTHIFNDLNIEKQPVTYISLNCNCLQFVNIFYIIQLHFITTPSILIKRKETGMPNLFDYTDYRKV